MSGATLCKAGTLLLAAPASNRYLKARGLRSESRSQCPATFRMVLSVTTPATVGRYHSRQLSLSSQSEAALLFIQMVTFRERKAASASIHLKIGDGSFKSIGTSH